MDGHLSCRRCGLHIFVNSAVLEGLSAGLMKKLSLLKRFYTFVSVVIDSIIYYVILIAFFFFWCSLKEEYNW